MRILWERRRASVQDILIDMGDSAPASGHHQVHVHLQRMLRKGYVHVDDERRPHYFTPLVDRPTVVRLTTQRFLDDVLDGHPGDLDVVAEVVAERQQRRRG